jgi:5'-nucleotidase
MQRAIDLSGYVVGVDVDEVCADMLTEWVRLYNIAWGDDLAVETIDDWKMTSFVTPECGDNIYKLLEYPNFYDNVQPIAGFPEGVAALREAGADIYYISTCVPNTADMNMTWLAQHDPGFTWKKFIAVEDKSLVRLDALIDDAPHHLIDQPRGVGTVRFRRRYNVGVPATVHTDGWHNIVDLVDEAITFRNSRYVEGEVVADVE